MVLLANPYDLVSIPHLDAPLIFPAAVVLGEQRVRESRERAEPGRPFQRLLRRGGYGRGPPAREHPQEAPLLLLQRRGGGGPGRRPPPPKAPPGPGHPPPPRPGGPLGRPRPLPPPRAGPGSPRPR